MIHPSLLGRMNLPVELLFVELPVWATASCKARQVRSEQVRGERAALQVQQPNDMLDESANRSSEPMTDDASFAACVMHHFASVHAVYSRAMVLMAVRRV